MKVMEGLLFFLCDGDGYRDHWLLPGSGVVIVTVLLELIVIFQRIREDLKGYSRISCRRTVHRTSTVVHKKLEARGMLVAIFQSGRCPLQSGSSRYISGA